MDDAEKTQAQLIDELTALRQRNAALEASDTSQQSAWERYQPILDALDDAVYTVDPDGRITFCNTALARLSGYEMMELIGSLSTRLYVPSLAAVFLECRQQAHEGEPVPPRLETVMVCKDGNQLPVELVVTTWSHDEHSSRRLTVVRNLTERHQTEAALREREVRYRELVEGSIQGISVVDQEGRRLYANSRYTQMLGYDHPQDLMGQPVRTNIAPADRDRLRRYALARFRGETAPTHFEYQGVRKDGTLLWLETIVSVITWEGQPAQLITVLDITARKKADADRQHLEVHLRQSQKMEALGTLAGGLAHEFNNVLNVIEIYRDLAQLEIPLESSALPHLESIQIASARARALVQNILMFSRQAKVVREPINLSSLVQDMLRFVQKVLPTSIDLDSSIQDEELIVSADTTQMYQVFMNLCANAEHAMRERGGLLEVRLEGVEEALPSAMAPLDAQPRPYVRLNIKDTGHGISPEVQDHIVEPFFTTKGESEDTGIGLSVVHGIVTDHDGVMTVDSTLDGGTTFTHRSASASGA